jgi:uncharacterized protein YgiM (DUF1202 family)
MVERHPLAQAVKSGGEAMNVRDVLSRVELGAATIAAIFSSAVAFAADLSPDSLKLAAGVAKAPAYETPATNYVVANSTNVYSDRWFYDTKVMGELKRGERVDVLAKVKGWEWVLVGKDGTGIGYVPISMLSPEDKYVP